MIEIEEKQMKKCNSWSNNLCQQSMAPKNKPKASLFISSPMNLYNGKLSSKKLDWDSAASELSDFDKLEKRHTDCNSDDEIFINPKKEINKLSLKKLQSGEINNFNFGKEKKKRKISNSQNVACCEK